MGPFVHHLLRLNLPVYSYNTCVAPTPSNLHLPQSHLLTLLIIANAGNMPRNTPLLVYLVYILACTKPKSGTQIFAINDAVCCSIPYHSGLYYNKWLKGMDVMLLKASGNTRSDKLRTILLVEADFNMNHKKMSREGMYIAKHHACIALEQAGGHNRHPASESSLNSQLIFGDSHSHRKAVVICSNGAKQCFDRIVHSVAFLCLRHFGIPEMPL